jgi:WD40 repeat protein
MWCLLQIRAVATSTADGGWIYTASRDCTIKGWGLSSNGVYQEAFTLAGHTDYVVSLAVFPSGISTDVPGKALLSGSRDKTAKIWDLDAKDAARTLTGHKWAVNGVGVLHGGEIATGELDGTLRVWKAGKAIRTLSEHAGAILCVLILPNTDILTGACLVLEVSRLTYNADKCMLDVARCQ